MKKKILSIALVVCLLATALVSGTLAYFTDTDAQKNTFVTGNVAIDLFEDFGDNDKDGIEKLIPATGSAQAGTLENGIEKEVYVENTGSEEAYVRVHIAIPTILDDGDPTFDASKNILHFNGDDGTYSDGKWNWSKTAEGNNALTTGMINPGAAWNFYTTSIDNTSYNVYVVTYETALAKNDVTVDAMYQVYLDSKVTNEDITKIINGVKDDPETEEDETIVGLGDKWYIYVAAEGAQKAGFDDAYEALNTAFGEIKAGYDKVDWAEVTGKTWVETKNINGK